MAYRSKRISLIDDNNRIRSDHEERSSSRYLCCCCSTSATNTSRVRIQNVFSSFCTEDPRHSLELAKIEEVLSSHFFLSANLLLVCQPVGSFYVLYDEAYEMTQSQNPRPSVDDERPFSYAARLKKGNGGRIHQQNQMNLGGR